MGQRKCNLCNSEIGQNLGVSFWKHNLCPQCVNITRRAVCQSCGGISTIRMIDYERTSLQVTCGENRTEYKTV